MEMETVTLQVLNLREVIHAQIQVLIQMEMETVTLQVLSVQEVIVNPDQTQVVQFNPFHFSLYLNSIQFYFVNF